MAQNIGQISNLEGLNWRIPSVAAAIVKLSPENRNRRILDVS